MHVVPSPIPAVCSVSLSQSEEPFLSSSLFIVFLSKSEYIALNDLMLNNELEGM